MSPQSPEDRLIENIARFKHDPLGFAQFAFDWGNGELSRVDGLRAWQADTLHTIGERLQNPATRHQPIQIAVASGHGIGKSALIGIILNWALSTCPDCRAIVTANTESQLTTKTSPEVGTWVRRALNAHWWDVAAMSVSAKSDSHKKTWRADFIPWSESNTEAFAGLHNAGKRLVVVMDEGSAIADKIWEVVEGALTDENTEIIWLVFGNPTRNTGRFRECFRRYQHRWIGRQIDSRTVEGTNKEQIQKWVDDYGEDSDFVKVRVRGIFPSAGTKQFISEADVDAAFGKHLRIDQYNFAPKIIGVDPAWEGDDSFVIVLRQGLASKILGVYPKNDNDLHMAGILARFEDDEQADAVFVDAGFGTGIISAGRTWNRNWQAVWFGGGSTDPGCKNKRAEMWKSLRDWLKAGGAIPNDNGLRDELMAVEAVPTMDGKLQLEAKDALKRRGIPSPNKADALAITFAFPVSPKARVPSGTHNPVRRDYNPYE